MLLLSGKSQAQTPVSWKFSTKKNSEKNYEIRIAATIQSPWHIYSQFTPEGGPVPTSITINKNPLLTVNGKPKELGTLVTKYEDVFKLNVQYFNNAVEFVQPIVCRAAVKMKVTGTVTFMTCNDSQCLPPSTIPFTISLQ